MKVYFLKRKGKNTWGNMPCSKELTYPDTTKVYADLLFYRKKDAQVHLNWMSEKYRFEITSATVKEV